MGENTAMKKLSNEFELLILKGEFERAKKIVKKFSNKELKDILFQISYSSGSIAPYGFICFLLQEYETSELHLMAAVLLSHGINHLPNAYNLALFHARRAVSLEPNSGNKEFLLFFHELPEKLISDNDAIKIAKEILKETSNSKIAKEIIDELGDKHEPTR